MKKFDLGERTFEFARDVRLLLKKLPNTITNQVDGRQLIRSSGSIGSNYREATDPLGEKDFIFRLRISRKEAKECQYWLELIKATNSKSQNEEIIRLITEAQELRKILSTIINKNQPN